MSTQSMEDLYTYVVEFDYPTLHYTVRYTYTPDKSIQNVFPLIGVDPYDGEHARYLAPVFIHAAGNVAAEKAAKAVTLDSLGVKDDK